MRKAEIDYLLTTMLEAFGSISDLNVTVGKPFQVESNGKLTEVKVDPPIPKITTGFMSVPRTSEPARLFPPASCFTSKGGTRHDDRDSRRQRERSQLERSGLPRRRRADE